MCLVTLAGCGNKEKPEQYVAEVSKAISYVLSV